MCVWGHANGSEPKHHCNYDKWLQSSPFRSFAAWHKLCSSMPLSLNKAHCKSHIYFAIWRRSKIFNSRVLVHPVFEIETAVDVTGVTLTPACCVGFMDLRNIRYYTVSSKLLCQFFQQGDYCFQCCDKHIQGLSLISGTVPTVSFECQVNTDGE